MLTGLEWKTLKFVFRLLCKSHATPFDWDASRSILVPTKSKAKLGVSFICFSVTAAYFIFVLIRLPETYHKPGVNGGDVVMHSLCCMWYGTVALWQFVVSFRCRTEFAALLNQQVNFNFSKGKKVVVL